MIAVGWLLLASLPVPSNGDPALANLLERQAAALEAERERLPELDEADRGTRVRRQLFERRAALIEAGVDEGFVDTLVPAGDAIAPGEPGSAAADVLRTTRRRLLLAADAARRQPPEDSDEAGVLLDEVLEDPVFEEQDTAANLVRRLTTAINRFMVHWLGGVGGALARHRRLMMFIALGVLVLTGIWVVARLFPAAARPTADEDRAAEVRPRATDAEDELSAAQAALSSGRQVETVRRALLAAILALRRSSLLPATPGLTDLEGADRLARRGGEIGDGFRQLVTIHDRGVYGGRAPDIAIARSALELAASLVRSSSEIPR